MSENSDRNSELEAARKRHLELEQNLERLVTGFEAMIRFQQFLWTLATLPSSEEVDKMIGEILDGLRLMSRSAGDNAETLSYFQNIGEACRNLSEVGRSAGDRLEPLVSSLREITQAYRERS